MNNMKAKIIAFSLFLIAGVVGRVGAEPPQMLGQAEEGGVIFQVGKSQVLMKFGGKVLVEIDEENNCLVVKEDTRPDQVGRDVTLQHANEAAKTQKRQKMP